MSASSDSSVSSHSASPVYAPSSPAYSPSSRAYHYFSDHSSDEQFVANTRRKIDKKPDRLSALPDSLILHILSFLRMKYVIRTGALSKRWRLLWTSAQTLVFRHSAQSNRGVSEFVKFINDTLTLCQPSKLNKFSVEFSYNKRYVNHVNKWMIVAKTKSVEVLDLYFRTRGFDESYSLPQIMYSNVSLRELSLCNCNLVPKEGINWPALRVLVIKYAKLSLDVVDAICSGCPALESIKFSMCYGIRRFHIDAESVKKLVISGYWQPEQEDSDEDDDDDNDRKDLSIWARNVTSLEIRGCFHKKIPVLDNVQSLVDAKLNFFRTTNDYENRESGFRTDQKMLKDLLVSLQHVEKLSIGSWCLQVLTVLEATNSSCPRMRCKYLNLSTRLEEWEVPGLAILLQSCPQVEILNISGKSYYEVYDLGWSFKEDSNDFIGESYWVSRPCLVLHLKTLRINCSWMCENYHSEHIISFMEAVLKNGIVLEKIILTSSDDRRWYSSTQHRRRVTEKLLSFPRSSKDAVILFSG
ncbi:F-box protein [Capsicum chacoense]